MRPPDKTYARTMVRDTTVLHLDEKDRFKAFDRNQRPFLVERVTFRGDESLDTTGLGIKVNGEPSVQHRDGRMNLSNLDPMLAKKILASHHLRLTEAVEAFEETFEVDQSERSALMEADRQARLKRASLKVQALKDAAEPKGEDA